MATVNQAYGTYHALAVTAAGIGSGVGTAWKSELVDNQTTTKAIDYELLVSCAATGTPANDKAVYVYICPAMTYDGGTNWKYADGGTGTLPTAGDATYTTGSPNSLRLLGVLSYNASGQTMQGVWNVSNAVGQSMPDGFLVILQNYCGQTLTSPLVAVRPITQTVA